ncbi:MAG: ATP phosphoribosyltransferase regulatory subunit [Firmicutes bacterium]|nr:ATP phosphoribosyltransferase regulatory subunit [Bacillota bacterium]
MNKLMWPIPTGLKDLLPEEAKRKRTLEANLAALFERWGYEEVITPTFEYYETLAMDLGSEAEDELFKFFDREGRLVALRPDMTTPIARLVATRLRNSPMPLRLYYLANVFRYEAPQAGRQREFYQAGVEFIGEPDARADAEVIALAVEALESSGLRDFQISLGQIEVFNGLMEETGLSPEQKKKVKETIARRNLVGLEQLLIEYRVATRQSESILRLPHLHGGTEVFTQARNLTTNVRAQAALDNLERVFELLDGYGQTKRVCVDLGVLRGFDYYTGVVFEGYTADLGFPLCGGGRYDRLLGKFGFDCPATGFALGLERLILSLIKG